MAELACGLDGEATAEQKDSQDGLHWKGCSGFAAPTPQHREARTAAQLQPFVPKVVLTL